MNVRRRIIPPPILAAGLIATAALAGLAVGRSMTRGPDGSAPSLDAEVRSLQQRHPARIWTTSQGLTPAGAAVLAVLRAAREDGLDPADYGVAAIDRDLHSGRPVPPDEELRLSTGLARYAGDLRRSPVQLTYVDQELAPSAPALEPLFAAVAAAPNRALQSLRSVNPVYDRLREGLKQYRARWSALPQPALPNGAALVAGSSGPHVRLLRQRLGVPAPGVAGDRYDPDLIRVVAEYQTVHGLVPSGNADRATIASLNAGALHYERIIALNLDRARVLPNPAERRYVLVDSAGAQLWMMDSPEMRDPMRVIVGKPEMATPQLAGLIRFAVTNPYWNVPPDLVRDSIAPKVLQTGAGYIGQRRMEVLANWSPQAQTVAPEAVDWPMVAAGGSSIRVRQLPGTGNVMGTVKFMLPNRLGIYLHDTWDKSGFSRNDRRLSSGCVRVAAAPRLAAWLFAGNPPPLGSGPPERRVDLPRPVPVYILHFTALPGRGGIRFQSDAYGRDSAILAASNAAKPTAQL